MWFREQCSSFAMRICSICRSRKGRHYFFCEAFMRFLTKDWYLKYIQVEWIKTLRVVFHTEYFSEQRYQWAYEQKEKQFIKHSKYDPLSVNHQSILKKVEKIIANPNILEADKERWREFYRMYHILNKEELSQKAPIQFDVEKTKYTFANRQKNTMCLVDMLPQEILECVADKRMLALGYTERKVKDKIKDFAKEQERWVELLRNQAINANMLAEAYMKEPVSLSKYQDGVIEKIVFKGNDLYIHFIDTPSLEIKNGKIIASEEPIYVWQEQDMYSPFSKMVGAEIEYGNDKFILRLLILNDNGFEKFTLAETLFECDGIYWVEK